MQQWRKERKVNNLKRLFVAAAMLVLPIAANAQLAYTAETVPLHAGPAEDYPVVAILGSGFAVTIQGCTQDYSWCDVLAGPHRGWIYGRYIVYSYQGTYVPVINYGAAIGIGVVTFVVGSYWQNHYTDRHWYRQMPHWVHRPQYAPIHPKPPRPGVHPGGSQHPPPSYRNTQWQTRAVANPRPTQQGVHLGRSQGPALGPSQGLGRRH
jgi:uncharacterized protein YraI